MIILNVDIVPIESKSVGTIRKTSDKPRKHKNGNEIDFIANYNIEDNSFYSIINDEIYKVIVTEDFIPKHIFASPTNGHWISWKPSETKASKKMIEITNDWLVLYDGIKLVGIKNDVNNTIIVNNDDLYIKAKRAYNKSLHSSYNDLLCETNSQYNVIVMRDLELNLRKYHKLRNNKNLD